MEMAGHFAEAFHGGFVPALQLPVEAAEPSRSFVVRRVLRREDLSLAQVLVARQRRTDRGRTMTLDARRGVATFAAWGLKARASDLPLGVMSLQLDTVACSAAFEDALRRHRGSGRIAEISSAAVGDGPERRALLAVLVQHCHLFAAALGVQRLFWEATEADARDLAQAYTVQRLVTRPNHKAGAASCLLLIDQADLAREIESLAWDGGRVSCKAALRLCLTRVESQRFLERLVHMRPNDDGLEGLYAAA